MKSAGVSGLVVAPRRGWCGVENSWTTKLNSSSCTLSSTQMQRGLGFPREWPWGYRFLPETDGKDSIWRSAISKMMFISVKEEASLNNECSVLGFVWLLMYDLGVQGFLSVLKLCSKLVPKWFFFFLGWKAPKWYYLHLLPIISSERNRKKIKNQWSW